MDLLDFIFPRRCLCCGAFGSYFCNQCVTKIKIISFNETICPMCGRGAIDGATHPRCQTRYSLDGLTSFFHYDGIVRTAIKTIKYRRIFDVAQEFVNIATTVSLTSHEAKQGKNSIMVPIPLHPSRFRERGFNQAEILGTFVAQKLNIPVQKDFLVRTKQTVPQVKMKKRKERLTNMEGVFGVDKFPLERKIVKRLPASIILFDDVFTTGATMRSAANVLKRNGAKFVWAVTMAR